MSQIKEETEKWLAKIRTVEGEIAAEGRGEEFLKNMKAYVSDSMHFLEKGDLVRAFECVIWAWAIYEICLELGLFRVKNDNFK